MPAESSLFDCFDLLDHGVEIRPIAGLKFGMEKLSIGLDFKRPTARRNQGQRLNALAQFENLGRQTDGLGRVVSDYTIFDRYLDFDSNSFPCSMVPAAENGVNRRQPIVVAVVVPTTETRNQQTGARYKHLYNPRLTEGRVD